MTSTCRRANRLNPATQTREFAVGSEIRQNFAAYLNQFNQISTLLIRGYPKSRLISNLQIVRCFLSQTDNRIFPHISVTRILVPPSPATSLSLSAQVGCDQTKQFVIRDCEMLVDANLFFQFEYGMDDLSE